MTLPPAARLGAPAPRIEVVPDGIVTSSGAEACEFGELVGVYLDSWQAHILDIALAERADGTWAAKSIDLLAPRQNGKNAALEVFELFAAVILGLSVLHTAHEFKTSMKAHARIRSLIRAHPDVASEVTDKWATPAQGYIFEFRSGGRIEFVTRSKSSGRGFTVDVLVLDEAQDLADEHLAALMPALSARSLEGDPQVWYLGSAPSITQLVWQRRRRAWRAGGSPASAAFEFSAHPKADLDDRDAWAQANPGLGIRITEEFIADVERASMSDEDFAKERLSISPEIGEDTPKVFGPGVYEAACSPTLAPPSEPVFALVIDPDRTVAAIGVAGSGGTCGLFDQRPGVGWAVDELIRVAREHGASVAVPSRGAAATEITSLEQAGVKVIPVTGTDMPVAAGQFYDAVVEAAKDRRPIIRRHAALDRAITAAAKKTAGDGFVWDPRTAEACALIAVTVARWAAAFTQEDEADVW